MKTIVLYTLAGLAIEGAAFAAQIPGMTGYFDQRIASVEKVACTMRDEGEAPVFPKMALADVNVDFSPTVTFGISGVVGLSISPEIDLILTPPVSP